MPGRFFKRLRGRTLAAGFAVLLAPGTVLAAGEAPTPPAVDWSFDGIFGTFDQASQQRGFIVYNHVCAACHAMSLMSRSEEHTSELQSLMRISYSVFCLTKKTD